MLWCTTWLGAVNRPQQHDHTKGQKLICLPELPATAGMKQGAFT